MIYTVIVLIIIGLAVNKISSKYIFEKLYFRREVSQKLLECNEITDITVIIENKKLMPVTFLKVSEKYPESVEFPDEEPEGGVRYKIHSTAMFLLPRQRVKRTFKARFLKRGRYILREAVFTAGDVFGLNTMDKTYEGFDEIIVMPKGEDINEVLVPYGDYYGDFSVKRWIIDDPMIITGIREYTGFEQQKYIHWPSSLRTGKLMVKQFDFTSDNNAMILVNIEDKKPFWTNINSEVMERELRIARSIAEEFEKAGIPYGLDSNYSYADLKGSNCRINPGIGTLHRLETLKRLGAADYSITMEFEEKIAGILKNSTGVTTYVIITPALNKEYIEFINMLGRMIQKLCIITFSEINADLIEESNGIYIVKGEKK